MDEAKRKERMRRVIGIALIWLALIAMVFLYTDPNEFAWEFEGGSGIWESEAQAALAQANAEQEMESKRQAAEAARAAGVWRDEDPYDGAPAFLPALGGESGLNLMRGRYRVTVDYASDEAFDVRAVSAGRQAFIRAGEARLDPAPAGASASFVFELTDAAQGVCLAGDLPEGASIANVRVQKEGTGVFSRDIAAYALLAGIVLTALAVLSWDMTDRGRARRRDALILLCAAGFASLPSLRGALIDGHDLLFHINRIEGIASGLRAGEFPVRIHSTTLLGYGYAAPAFYPEAFLYIPALLRCAGVSPTACLCVFQIAVNLAAAFVCYGSARRLFDSRRIAVGAVVLYTLCIDRVVNLYVRAGLGESVASVFFPLLVSAMADVLTGDERRWPVLSLAMLGVFMSHLLSTLFAVMLCALAALCCVRRLLREPRRLLAIGKAAALMALCSAWFFVPFLQYSAAGLNTNVMLETTPEAYAPGSLLIPFSGNMTTQPDMDFAYHVGVVPGAALLAGCALLLMELYARGRTRRDAAETGEEEKRDKLAGALLALGALALLGSTSLFPWERLCAMRRPISTIFRQMQFPWRMVGMATPLLALAGAYGYLRNRRNAAAGMALLTGLSMVFCGYTLTAHLQRETAYGNDVFCDTRIGQYEYLYMGTYKSALEAGRVTVGDVPVEPTEYVRHGSTLDVTIDLPAGYFYFELPVLYYPGYRATVNGVEKTVGLGTNNVLRVYDMDRPAHAQIHVWFEPPLSWLIAQGVSLAGIAVLIGRLVFLRKRIS